MPLFPRSLIQFDSLVQTMAKLRNAQIKVAKVRRSVRKIIMQVIKPSNN